MTTFYFQVEMTKPYGQHWTIGLNLDAETYNEALRLFRAWAFGVEAISSLIPHLRNISDEPTPDRSYFNMDLPGAIREEMTLFTGKDSYDSDDNNCPF